MSEPLPVVEIIFDKENFESHIDADNDVYIEHSVWSEICSDLENRLWESFESIINNAVKDYNEGFYDEPKDSIEPERLTL